MTSGVEMDGRSVPSWIYTDPSVEQEERRLIFAGTWNFLAHETEVPQPGDFVVRFIGSDSLIVVRGDDGVIRGFYNVCRHRGMQVCRADVGHVNRFTCAYHGWLYDVQGKLVAVPLERPYFGQRGLDRGEHSLRPIARLEVSDGFVFGSLSETVISLEEFLGDFAWYLAIHSQRDPAGLEVVGAPQRWLVRGNWKSGSENAMGDSYHAQYTHRSVMEAGIHPNQVSDWQSKGSRNGVHVDAGNATIAFARQSPDARGYPPSMVEMFQRNLPAPQRRLIFDEGPLWPTRAAVFPNLMLLNGGAYLAEGHVVPFLFCRVWRPMRPDLMEVWNWVLVERSASDEFKRESQRAYLLTFGPAGTEEQDDAENFMGVSHALSGLRSREVEQPLSMGYAEPERRELLDGLGLDDWAGPGRAVASTYTDAGSRRFAMLWSEAMEPAMGSLARKGTPVDVRLR